MCCGGASTGAPDDGRNLFDALIDPQSKADDMAGYGLLAGLFNASAPSTDPRHGSLGYVLGQGLQGAMDGMQQGAAIDARRRADAGGIVDVQNDEQCDALPVGAICRFPDGRRRYRM